MAKTEANSKDPPAVDQKRKRVNSHRPLLVQKFSVASIELRVLTSSNEIRILSTVDFYVDSKGVDRRMVGSMSPEEPEGRLFNTKGEPVILAPGEQCRYLHQREQKSRDPNGKYEFLDSVEGQHGGKLRFEPWYNDLFWEDRMRHAQMPGFVDLNELLRKTYGNKPTATTTHCQDYHDQKHASSQKSQLAQRPDSG